MTFRRCVRMLLVAGLLLPAGVSVADVGSAFKCHRRAHPSERRSTEEGGGQETIDRQTIPEFDPAAAGTIAALLMGGGVLLVRHRRVR